MTSIYATWYNSSANWGNPSHMPKSCNAAVIKQWVYKVYPGSEVVDVPQKKKNLQGVWLARLKRAAQAITHHDGIERKKKNNISTHQVDTSLTSRRRRPGRVEPESTKGPTRGAGESPNEARRVKCLNSRYVWTWPWNIMLKKCVWFTKTAVLLFL